MERGFAVGDAHQSMFSESLASSERILGATNAQRPSPPSWMRRDVPSTHFDASHAHGAMTRIEKSHNGARSGVSILSDREEDDVNKGARHKHSRELTSKELATMYDEIDQGMTELQKRVAELTQNEETRRIARRRARGACGVVREGKRRKPATSAGGNVSGAFDPGSTDERSSSVEGEGAYLRTSISAVRGQGVRFRTVKPHAQVDKERDVKKLPVARKQDKSKVAVDKVAKSSKPKKKKESSSSETSIGVELEEDSEIDDKKRKKKDDEDPSSEDSSSTSSSDRGRGKRSRRHRTRKKPRKWLIPEKFDGTTPLNIFLGQFESCAMYNKWSVNDKVTHLRIC